MSSAWSLVSVQLLRVSKLMCCEIVHIGVIACFAVTFFTKSPKNLFPDYAEKLPRAFSSSSHSDKAAAVTGERIATQLELLQAP